MRVRSKALALLLPLTLGDYLLWNWSVGGSHDVVALASGMTLLPLAVVSLGLLGLTALRALAHGLRRSSTMARSVQQPSRRAHARRSSTGATERSPSATGAHGRGSQPTSPSNKLAA
jgi:hypothetical protein